METDLEAMAGCLRENGYIVRKAVLPPAADSRFEAYQPYVNDWAIFTPWAADPDIREIFGVTLVSADRLWILKTAVLQTRGLAGEVWEMGVYRGGTARMLRKTLEPAVQRDGGAARLRLFDTFSGMPAADRARDVHVAGNFSDTSLEAVRRLVGEAAWIDYRPGFIPDTFAGLEASAIRFAHVDLDIYQSIADACEFVYPRLVPGGLMVFDDYGFWSCPGAREAVDEFFSGKPERPFALPTGQALVAKLP